MREDRLRETEEGRLREREEERPREMREVKLRELEEDKLKDRLKNDSIENGSWRKSCFGKTILGNTLWYFNNNLIKDLKLL